MIVTNIQEERQAKYYQNYEEDQSLLFLINLQIPELYSKKREYKKNNYQQDIQEIPAMRHTVQGIKH